MFRSFQTRARQSIEDLLPLTVENNNQWQWSREMPEHLTGPALEHAATLLEAFKTKTSTKIDLLRANPDYLAELAEKGVDIANFWNKSDTEIIVGQFKTMLATEELGNLLKEKFQATFGLPLEETSDHELRAVADDLQHMCFEIYEHTSQRLVDFTDLEVRLQQQLIEAREAKKPKRKLEPIVNWLRQSFPEFSSFDIDYIESFIAANRPALELTHQQRQQPLKNHLEQLARAVDDYPALRFMQRSKFDLMSGNITRDCTAWNLECGFNAHTVPLWLTSPGFNFAYIEMNDKPIAKMGLILAFNGNKPQIVVDSIETSKDIPKGAESAALAQILEGLGKLQEWSHSRGFGVMRVCTFSNSTELTMSLPLAAAPVETTEPFLFIHGDKQSSFLQNGENDQMYLQSDDQNFEAGVDEEGNEATQQASEFETLLQAAQTNLPATQSESVPKRLRLITKSEAMDIFRTGKDEAIKQTLVTGLLPRFSQAFKFNTINDLFAAVDAIEQENPLMDAEEYNYALFDSLATVLAKEIGPKSTRRLLSVNSDFETVARIDQFIDVKSVPEAEKLVKAALTDKFDEFGKEARQVFDTILRIRKLGDTEELAKQVFGATSQDVQEVAEDTETEQIGSLNRNLGTIAISSNLPLYKG